MVVFFKSSSCIGHWSAAMLTIVVTWLGGDGAAALYAGCGVIFGP